MVEPYMGQVFIFGFNFAPKNYQLCASQLLAISTNQALFSILGTTYGGNGTQTFALPDLRGRVYNGQGTGPGLSNYVLGEITGTPTVTLLQSNLPMHNHIMGVNNGVATTADPTGAFMSQGAVISGATVATYTTATLNQVMAPTAVAASGGNQPINITQPYLAINFSIALFGVFPSRN